ncbi:MAG: hypothetical protein HUJ62_05610 [Streptococcus gallolyticus]|nr:hypothetical protein [Streptococcus gallolyticus]
MSLHILLKGAFMLFNKISRAISVVKWGIAVTLALAVFGGVALLSCII